MSALDPARYHAAVDATWPAAELLTRAGWVLRRGAGGGQRVSAASAGTPGATPGIAAAAAAMARWGQKPLFRVDASEPALDAALEGAGFRVHDPVLVFAAPVAALTDPADETARVIRVSTPLALVEEIWAAGGIGPGRLAVMARAAGPKIVLMARLGDRPAGVAFVACDREVAMLHAVEVLTHHGRGELGGRAGGADARARRDRGQRPRGRALPRRRHGRDRALPLPRGPVSPP